MRTNHLISLTAAAILGITAVGPSDAAIISANPNADFAGDGYMINLANGAASYDFMASSNPFLPSTIQTDGNGLINTVAGSIATYGIGDKAPFIDGNLAGIFERYPYGAPITDSGPTTIALGLDLSDGLHYGYAQIDGSTLVRYGYESVPGRGLRAGATANAVPEPSSWLAFGVGLALLGLGLRRRQRTCNQPNV